MYLSKVVGCQHNTQLQRQFKRLGDVGTRDANSYLVNEGP